MFKTKKEDLILKALQTLFERMVSNHKSPPITKNQVYEALVRPEHMAALREADKTCGVVQRHSNTQTRIALPNGNLVNVYFNFIDTLDRLLPAYATQGFHPDADPELRETVTQWVTRRWSIGRDFALAKAAFRQLNDECASVSQARIHFPGILSLMNLSKDEVMIGHAAKYGEAGVPASLPSIHPELRRTLMDATKLIARTQLLSEEKPIEREVTLGMSGSLGVVALPWNPPRKVDIE